MNAKSARWLYQDDGPDPDPETNEVRCDETGRDFWTSTDHYDCDPVLCPDAAYRSLDYVNFRPCGCGSIDCEGDF